MVLESNTLDVLFVKDGQQGEDGKILYTWIKYAKDANGTGMTDDPNGAVYIGISYNNESSTESNDPTQYAWTKIQGADGKKGEDAYTIFLENENISFATDENRDPLSEQAYTSGITIMKGAKPVTDFTIGDIAKTQGIAVAKTDTAIAISVINGNPLPNDSGVIEIPISVGGTVFKKILSWTCSKKGDQGIQGIQGPQGVQGEKGKDGTSVTITNKSITYQLSASGTVVPTGTWQTSPQTIPEGQYQWTKTSVTYSDGNKTESYSISYRGKNGSDGTSVKTTSTSVKYQVGDSGTTKPTGTWQNNVPTVAQGKYLWTQTIVNYSDGNSTESYSVSYKGIDGSNGSNGMNAATVYLYQRATSTPSKPSNTLTYTFSTTKITGTLNNGWSTAIPTGTDAVYVTVASVSSKNDTVSIATSAWSAPVVLAQNGKSGSDGKAGLNVATIYLYQRATSKPSKPSASVTYTFSTGVASGLNNGWSQKIPDGTNPLYVTLATASSNTATDTILNSEWSDVVVMAQNGEDGQDGISPKVTLSKSGNTTTISIVDATGTHTQTVKDGTNGTPGTAGKDGKTSYFHVKYSNDGGKTFTGNSGEDVGTYMGSYTDYTETDSTNVGKYTWVKVKGDKGDTGQKGQDGTSVKITSKSVTYQASTSGTTAPTGTWSTSVPTVNNGQYLWTKTTVQYSDGNKTEAYSVSYKGTNGTNGTSVTVSKTEVTYQVSTSGTTAPTGTWSTTMPTCDQGLYLWTKTYVKYSDGKDTTSYSVSYKGVDGEKFSWNMINNGKGNEKRGFFKNFSSVNATEEYGEITLTSKHNYIGIDLPGFVLSPRQYEVGKKVTWSYDIMYTKWDFPTGSNRQEYWMGQRYTNAASGETATGQWVGVTSHNLPVVGQNGCELNKWFHVEVTKTIPTPSSSNVGYQGCINFYNSTDISATVTFRMKNVKLEYGDTATPWSPSQSDLKGEKGDNAKNLSITPSSQYFKSTDGGKTFAPNTITIKPTIQGEISFGKWQYSIDGGVSFADVVSGQKWLTISNNALSVSKDSSLYSDAVTMVTFRAVANDSSFYDTCSIAKIYDVSELEIGGVNLFVKSTASRGWWLSDTGVLNANGGWGYSDYIDVSGMKNYIASGFTNLGISPATCFYDSNKTFISGVQSTNQNSQDSKRKTLPIPSNAKYMRFSFMLTDIDTLKIEQGTKATAYSSSPQDVQTAILSTKSEISDVSLKVDKNKQAIEQRVEKTTYEQDLTLVKGDISKANEGLNKWRYEIYPKSLFASEYQGKSTMDVFAKNTNLTPSQSMLINDTDLGKNWAYGDNYIGYALTFAKFSAAKSVAITFKHDDGAHLYLNGKLVGGDDTCNTGSGQSLTLSFVQGWNCLEVVLNEKSGGEYIGFGTTISAISECQLMNCYYGTPVARQSHITNQLVQNTTDIEGVTTKVGKVTSVIGEDGKNFTDFKNDYSDFKQTMNGFKTTVGQTYVTKDDFNGLEIGGRNLLLYSQSIRAHSDYYGAGWLTDETETFNGNPVWSVKNQWGRLTWLFKTHVIDRGLVKVGDVLTYSLYAKTNNASGKSINCSYRFKGNANAHWFNNSAFSVGTSWTRYSVTFTVTKDMLATDTYMTEIGFEETASMSGDDKVYYACPKLERGTKATDYTPAPEDNEINGQNLVSNLPSNWEQGSIYYTANLAYGSLKTTLVSRLRTKDVFPVSGNITISAGTSTNSSKEELNFYYVLFDINKKSISHGDTWQSLTSPKIINCGNAKYMAIILRWGSGSTAITPSDISQICLKIERGTSATPFTLAPEDVNGKIVNVETIANQTARQFEWIVKGGDSSSNFTLTDRVADLVAKRINFKGLVAFSGLNTDAKNEIGKVAQSKVDGLEVGGRNLIINSNLSRALTNVTNDGCSNMTVVSDSVYGHALKFTAVNQRRVFWATSNVWVRNKTYTVSFVAKSSVTGQKIRPSRSTADWGDDITLTTSYARYTTKITSWDTNAGGTLSFSCTNAVGDITITNVKLEVGNKATDWTPAPEDVSQDATDKANQALTDAKNYSSNAVNWVTNNGASTTNLNSMVKKWTDGAVSDTTQINGGWIKANTITASKIAVGDFTNYADISESNTYWFLTEQTKEGTWFYRDGSALQRDNVISESHTCRGGETFYVEYDISNTIKEGDEYKYAGLMIFGYDGNGGIVSYNRNAGATATANGEITHISTQLTMPDTTRSFRVYLQIEGHVPFTGTLKIRNVSVRKAATGNLIVDGSITADKIATDAIKSRNYISSGGTQGSFLNLSDGSFKSPNLSWDSNGNLIATGANISGQITATTGSIGKFTITDQWLITGSGSTCAGLGGSGQAFWAGAENSTVAPFRVDYDGKFVSSNADITGTITATNGKIGRYDITSTYLMTNSGSNASGIGGDQAFWAGAEDSNSAPFRVGYDGVLWAENAAIRGSIETGNLGDEGDTVSIINGHIGIQGASNNVEIYSTGFKFGIDGDYYLESVSDGVKCYRNLYATDLKASGWLYASEVHSSGAVVIASDSESFYWAHGYQIARGTSWGGVCIGDDSQGLRLYGTSIWASHGISTSDENLKENFTTLDQYEDFYMNLNPIGFNYIGDYDGKKTHFGFGAHKTEDILESEGYDSDKFAVVTHRPLVQEDIEKRFGKDVEVDIETEYGISYTEFIALNTHMIQKTRRELTKVKQEKTDLEARLQAIEAKLGL